MSGLGKGKEGRTSVEVAVFGGLVARDGDSVVGDVIPLRSDLLPDFAYRPNVVGCDPSIDNLLVSC